MNARANNHAERWTDGWKKDRGGLCLPTVERAAARPQKTGSCKVSQPKPAGLSRKWYSAAGVYPHNRIPNRAHLTRMIFGFVDHNGIIYYLAQALCCVHQPHLLLFSLHLHEERCLRNLENADVEPLNAVAQVA